MKSVNLSWEIEYTLQLFDISLNTSAKYWGPSAEDLVLLSSFFMFLMNSGDGVSMKSYWMNLKCSENLNRAPPHFSLINAPSLNPIKLDLV